MGIGYQKRDHEIIDYELWELEGIGRPLRGPKPEEFLSGKYITCVGAAQTFGCYAEKPFPMLLSEELHVPVLNLGVAGAGPSFFLNRPGFLPRMNSGKAVVLQVMSGRSVSNRLFESNGLEMLTRRSDGKKQGAAPMYRELLRRRDHKHIASILDETRDQWVEECTNLLNQIDVPSVLLWFSVRTPEYLPSLDDVDEFFGSFPQLVNREMIEQVKSHCTRYVECVSKSGLPQPLYSRFTGKPAKIKMRSDLGGRSKRANDYYPSPQMHREAAEALLRSASDILG